MRKRMGIRLLAVVLAMAMLFAVPVAAAEEDVVIVLDPGHGGLDSGTEMKYDGKLVCEAAINLSIAEACRDYLLENYENVQVYLTRETDVKVSLEERVAFAEEVGADYMLSIHINSDEGYAKGALAIVPRGRYQPEQGAASKRTAEAILLHLEALGMVNRGTTYMLDKERDDRYPDGSYVDNFAVIRGCVRRNIPCIIMEHGFLDNEEDYRSFLSTPEQLRALGEADALGLAETLGLIPMGSGTPFSDVPYGTWYTESVRYVWEQGLMEGISDTEFGPALRVNRAMVVTILYSLDGAELYPEESSFADVPAGSWYHAPVEWALENGVTSGFSETEFGPGRNIIREQFVAMLYRYAGSPEPEVIPVDFSDWERVTEYARPALAWAVEAGIVSGYDDGTVKPHKELNRAELAAMMRKFHIWLLHDRGELVYEWTQSVTEAALYVGDSFELTLVNQYGEQADALWTADCEGVVEVDGTTVTAVGEGTALLSCETDGQWFDCFVEVTEHEVTWSISHTDVTIKVGESFYLKVRSSEGETAPVSWSASKSGYVSISGNKITGKKAGTVTVSCTHEGVTYKCIVRVKSA